MKIIKFLPILVFTFSCSAQINLDKYIVLEEGIVVEKSDSTKPYDEIYNNNNIIYSNAKKFTYGYFYQNLNDQKFLVKRGKQVLQPNGYSSYDWELVNIDKQDNETINHITLRPSLGNPFLEHVPDYNQTAIDYEYLMNNGQSFSGEVTGAIENENNIWIHPPRSNFFEILELNPFPYIKAPYKIGTKWNWALKIGDNWSNNLWLEWEGIIENKYDYEIINKKNVLTKIGDLECYIVQAKAKSRIGETELISYFNHEFGFVKLEYKNIDGTKIVLEIENVE